ncbi:YecA family protein [Ammoniphilus sp. YIM 78166]|uniref:YecA family protein n=1 Tax=Ammoniphilus sp. YIM 78166 TaxID=1644106 RepID=UPI00106FBEBD|nr:SEC-C metal-binding domain-containing protein [Ammoniphilus sp. YIM 78166]
MNFLDKIEPFILSDDPIVQEYILHTFRDYPDVPEQWTEKLINEALHSKEKETNILINIENHNLSEGAVQALLKGLKNADRNKVHLFAQLLNHVEPDIAMKLKDELTPLANKEAWSFYELLLNGSEEEIWEEYGATLGELEDSTDFVPYLFTKAKKLARVLARKGWITEDELDIVMNEQLEREWFSYEGILNIYFIQLLKGKKHIPTLASLLVRDEDILLEEVSDALISFQSDEVVQAISPYLTKKESFIFAFSILENTKTPSAIEVLRDLQIDQKNEDHKELYIQSICYQLNPDLIPELERTLQQGYSSFLTDTERNLYSFYTILGENHPQLQRWGQVVQEKELHFQKQLQKMNVAGPKVGRNEPCICGSGKKYKKCCGA